MTAGGDRTIPATPRRREAARDAGQAPTAAVLTWPLLAALVLSVAAWWVRATIAAAVTLVQAAIAGADPGAFGSAALAVIGPTVAVVAAGLGLLLGVRLLGDNAGWRLSRAGFRAVRIDPVTGLRRLLTAASWIRGLLSLVSLLGLLAVAWLASGPLVRSLSEPPDRAGALPMSPLAAAETLLWWLVVAALAVAFCQWTLQRLLFERQIRMTPQEYRDELRSLRAEPRVRWPRKPGA